MAAPAQLLPAAFSLAAVFAWGTSDFVGGYGAKRANAFFFTAIAHASGLMMMAAIALLARSPFPARAASLWALAAGAVGGISLAIFYRALAAGKMGLTAPVAALLGAGIPTIFAIVTEGAPGRIPLAGFLVAGAGILLITRTEDGAGRPQGLGMAALAGVGFAGFYLCIKQAGPGSALWIATLSRAASFLVTSAVVLLGRHLRGLDPRRAALGVLAGCLDVAGSALFIRASQIGRLDTAVVLSSLYPAVTVLLARILLRENFTRWRTVGMLAALAAVPMIALQ